MVAAWAGIGLARLVAHHVVNSAQSLRYPRIVLGARAAATYAASRCESGIWAARSNASLPASLVEAGREETRRRRVVMSCDNILLHGILCIIPCNTRESACRRSALSETPCCRVSAPSGVPGGRGGADDTDRRRAWYRTFVRIGGCSVFRCALVGGGRRVVVCLDGRDRRSEVMAGVGLARAAGSEGPAAVISAGW